MNGVISKFLLAGDKFMPEMHLRQSILDHLMYKFKDTRDSRRIYQNELDKVCFQYDKA